MIPVVRVRSRRAATAAPSRACRAAGFFSCAVALLLGARAGGAPEGEARPGSGLEEAVRRGVDFLLAAQRKDGSWGTGETRRPIEVLADVPGSHQAFRAGTTALCAMALDRSPHRQEESKAAARRGLLFLLEKGRVRRPNGMELYNVWTFGYSLQAFAELFDGVEDPALRDRMLAAAAEIVRALQFYQTLDGGWGYYDFAVGSYRPGDSSMTFTTATILIGLKEMEEHGLAVPSAMVDRAIRMLRSTRKDDGSYLYGFDARYRPAIEFNEVKGSLGRTQSCNLALWMFGENVTRADLRGGVERLYRHHHFIDIGRKRPWPHEAWYYTAGYYFYYGHYYAGRVIDLLPGEERDRLRPRLAAILIERQEPDGSWWDFPFYGYHKAYGTAFSLLTLIR